MTVSIKKQVKKGLAWRGGADISQRVLQVVFTIIFARLLTKADFGLVAKNIIVLLEAVNNKYVI